MRRRATCCRRSLISAGSADSSFLKTDSSFWWSSLMSVTTPDMAAYFPLIDPGSANRWFAFGSPYEHPALPTATTLTGVSGRSLGVHSGAQHSAHRHVPRLPGAGSAFDQRTAARLGRWEYSPRAVSATDHDEGKYGSLLRAGNKSPSHGRHLAQAAGCLGAQ